MSRFSFSYPERIGDEHKIVRNTVVLKSLSKRSFLGSTDVQREHEHVLTYQTAKQGNVRKIVNGILHPDRPKVGVVIVLFDPFGNSVAL